MDQLLNENEAPPAEPITVLMPVRNGGNALKLALSDLAEGIDAHDELLVIDDGSDDQTPGILNEAKQRIPQLRVISTSHSGLVSVLNLGIGEATHDWIARADADDRYPVDRFSHQRSARNPDVGLVVGDYRIVGPSRPTTIPCALGSPFVALSLLHPQRFPHPGVLFHREAVQMAGRYMEEDFPAEDLGLWMRMSGVCRMVGVPQEVVYWHIHPTSTSHQRRVSQQRRTEQLLHRFSLPAVKSICAEAVERELQSYEATELHSQRSILLLRDLLRGRGIGVGSSAVFAAGRYLSRHGFDSVAAIGQLWKDAAVRRRFRAEILNN